MKILPSILFYGSTLLIVACQKEYSIEKANFSAEVPILVKYTLSSPGFSTESAFKYNASRQVVEHNLKADASPLFTLSNDVRATRANSNQRLSKVNVISKLSTDPDPMTIEYRIFRDASGKITYFLLVPGDFATNGYDSVVCKYGTNNHIIENLVYLVSPNGLVAEPVQRLEMGYAADNLVSWKDFDLPGTISGGVLDESVTFEFDTRPAAMPLDIEEFIMGLGLDYAGKNNIIKITREFPNDPSENRITEYKYTYLPNGRPATAEVTTKITGLPEAKATSVYTYN